MKRKYVRKINYGHIASETSYQYPKKPKDLEQASVWATWKRFWDQNAMPHKHAKFYGEFTFVEACWWDFDVFFADVGPRPEGCFLVRLDSTKPYGPNNFKWSPSRGGRKSLVSRKEARKICVRLLAGRRPRRIAEELDVPVRAVYSIAAGTVFADIMRETKDAMNF